jgi:hypothetical protein
MKMIIAVVIVLAAVGCSSLNQNIYIGDDALQILASGGTNSVPVSFRTKSLNNTNDASSRASSAVGTCGIAISASLTEIRDISPSTTASGIPGF